MKKIMNVLKSMKSEFKAGYNQSKASYDAKFANTVAKAEEASYNVVKAAYVPAYAAGYISDMGAIKKASNIAHNIAEDVKFSAKEGYANGKEAHAYKVSNKEAEAKVIVTHNLAQSIDKWTESPAAKQAAQELAAKWQKEFEDFCQREDEEQAVYYGDGIWTGDTAF